MPDEGSVEGKRGMETQSSRWQREKRGMVEAGAEQHNFRDTDLFHKRADLLMTKFQPQIS